MKAVESCVGPIPGCNGGALQRGHGLKAVERKVAANRAATGGVVLQRGHGLKAVERRR